MKRSDQQPMDSDVLAALQCEIDARPAGAPTLDDVLPLVRGTVREPEALVVAFDPQGARTVEAFAAAEQLCCAGAGWTVTDDPEPALRIEAAPAQLDVLAPLFEMPAG